MEGSRDKHPTLDTQSLIRELGPLSGRQIVERVIEDEQVRSLLPKLPPEDFFWLIKKVGEDDSLPLLEVVTIEQWQYLLDLELWKRDRLDLGRASNWLGRLQQANAGRVLNWIFGEGESFAYLFFYKKLEVEVRKDDEVYDLKDGFFTYDGVFYIRILDAENREVLEQVLRNMATHDHERFQALLLSLSGVIPAEVEEEMYRIRNVRLAEHGFLPFEEALSVYGPLSPEVLRREPSPQVAPLDLETLTLAPRSALESLGGNNLLTEVTSKISDSFFLDRLNLEFAGLCNQILAADGVEVDGFEVLIRVCRKTAGYLNLALEKLCMDDRTSAERLLENNPLIHIFRVGFGFALRLKWEAERWLKNSWFVQRGLSPEFWGDPWGGLLLGLLEKRPKFYAALLEGREEYRDFQSLAELDLCLSTLARLRLLDRLLDRLTQSFPVEKDVLGDPTLTFHRVLFHWWMGKRLGLRPDYRGVSLFQAKALFLLLRTGEKAPPYRMARFEREFVNELMDQLTDQAGELDQESRSLLQETLRNLWEQFREEYEWVQVSDLDPRFTKFIRIRS